MSGPSIPDYAPILEPFVGQKGAIIDALKAIQDREGYVSDEAIRAVAETLHVSRNTVYGVVTFYEFFYLHPPATKTIRYCMGTVCDAVGGRDILETITDEIGIKVGETSADGKWTLERLPCFGTCSLAPMMQINDEAFTHLTQESVRTILSTEPEGDSAPIAGDGRPAPNREEIMS